jgi:hypothetical protein
MTALSVGAPPAFCSIASARGPVPDSCVNALPASQSSYVTR